MRTLKKIRLEEPPKQTLYRLKSEHVRRLLAEGVAEVEVNIDDATMEIKIEPVREVVTCPKCFSVATYDMETCPGCGEKIERNKND